MTMLPDIDEQDWNTYQSQNLQDQIQQKISSFSLDRMIGDKVADLQSLVGQSQAEEPPPPPPPEPPPPPPQPEPPEVTAARAQYNAPTEEPAAVSAARAQFAQPAPSPAPPPEPSALPDYSAPVVAPPPAPTPAPAPVPPPTPSPSPSPSSSNDWFGQMLGRVASTGGDVQTFANNFSSGASDQMSNLLGAASSAGSNVQDFAQGLTLPPPQAAATSAGALGPSGATGASGVPGWLSDLIAQNAPPGLAADPDFIRTVAAGAKAESGWDPNRIQQGFAIGSGKGARGLFQFDMGGMGAGMDESSLLGDQGAAYQASKIVPLYAQAYMAAPQNLSGAEKASWVASRAERPLGMDDPGSAARRNYASAYNEIGGGDQPIWQQAGNAIAQGAQAAVSQISQFGDRQLSADEAYAACGPAAAVRFASLYGRNPSLREATDLAAQVGWTSAQGMAGLGSEKALMDKLGVPTHMVGADITAMAREASTGNPVTISTPGHYFFADGYDANTGAFHVGQSGLDLKGGSEWMTADQIQQRMGTIQGALFADNPQVPQPSTADAGTNPLGFLDRAKDAITSKWQDLTQPQDTGPTVDPITGKLQDLGTGAQALNASTPGSDILDALGQSDVARTIARANAGIMATEPGAPASAVLEGLQGRLTSADVGAVPGWEERAQTPGDTFQLGPLGQVQTPLGSAGQALGKNLSLVGTALKLGADIGNEVNPLVAGSRVEAGTQNILWADPEYRSLMGQLGIDENTGEGDRATRLVSLTPAERPIADAITQRRRELLGGLSQGDLAAAAWNDNARREDYEGRAQILSGLAAMAVAPEGLASGAGRFAASLALDPGGAPMQGLSALPELAKLGRVAPEAADALRTAYGTAAEDLARNLSPEEAQALARRSSEAGVVVGQPGNQTWDQAARLADQAQGIAPEDLAIRPTTQAEARAAVGAAWDPGSRVISGEGASEAGRFAEPIEPPNPAKTRTTPFNGNGYTNGKTDEGLTKLILPGAERAPSSITDLVSPAGNLLSTVTSGEARVPGAKPAWNDIAGISRQLAGSEPWTINAPSEEVRKAMPNLLHMANDMPEVQATIQRIAEDNPELMGQYTQGTISHADLTDLASKLGMTTQDFLNSKVGKAFNPQELLALRGAIADKHDQIAEMSRYIKATYGSASKMPDEVKVAAVRQILEAAQLQAVGRGAAATAGRALNQQKINVDRGIASMLTRGNELASSRRAVSAAKAREAWANAKAGNPLPEVQAAATEAAGRGGDAIRTQAREAGSLYDQWIKAAQDELKAHNNFDEKAWDQGLKDAEARAAKALPKDATAEGQRAWAQAEARNAARDAELENRRAVAAWNRKLAEGETQRNIAGRILDRVGGENITNDMIDHLVKVMNSDNPMDAAKYLQSLQKVTWWDRLATMRYASMLSSTATHAAQAVSNTAQLGMALGTHPLAVAADIATQAVKGGERQRYMSELPAMLRGIIGQAPSELADSPYMVRGAAGGLRQGASDAWEIMKSGLNPGEISRNWEQVGQPGFGFEQTALGKKLGAGISGKVNFVAEGPLRTLEAGDSLIRGAARGAFAHGLAERQAIREGYSGAAKADRVNEIIRNFDEFPELFAQADDAAKRVVMQEQRPGGLASGLMSARRGKEGLAMSLVMPFVRTPWNVAAQGAGMTPLGYLSALSAAGKGQRGEAVDRAARATLGTGIMGAATALAANGYLTGGTPSDPSEKSSLEPGWQPYSLRIPHEDGSATFVKYSNLGPAGVPLAAGAILGDAWKDAQKRGAEDLPVDPGAVVGKLAGGMGRYMVDQTMLQGVANTLDAIGDPERKGDNFLQGLVTQFAPYAALGRQLDRALGTGPRDTRTGTQGLLDAVMSVYPGLSGNVPQRQDPLGRPVQATQTGLGAFLSPATYSQSPYDPYTEAMRGADVGIGAPEKAWKGFAMNEDEQRLAQQQTGYYLEQMMRPYLQSPDWNRVPIEQRQAILRDLISSARNAGGADIMSRLGETELQKRYTQQKQLTAPVPR